MVSFMNNDVEISRNPNPTSDPDFSFSVDSPNEKQISTDPSKESQDLEDSRVMARVSTGDMVWGKVKSHPWWPGHVYNENFASPSVRRMKSEDFCLVAFFGDSSYGWFDPAELIPFEPNFLEKSKQTTLKSFVKAVDESIDEMSRRAALSISCRCRNPYNFRPARVPNYYEVDVVGYERNGIYSKKQIVKERKDFQPLDVVGFLKRLAVAARGGETKDVNWYRNIAAGLALRRAMFEEFDETYAQAFGQEPVRPVRDEMGVLEQAESFAPRVTPLSGPLVIAEALGTKKNRSSISRHSSISSSSPSLLKPKDKSTHKKKKKNDNFVLKRREDHQRIFSSPPPPPPPPTNYTSASISKANFSSASSSEYVLQKREQPIEDTKHSNVSGLFEPNMKEEVEGSPQTPPLPSASSENYNIAIDEKPMAPPLHGAKKAKKIKKRPLDDVINSAAGKQETNIKKKKQQLESTGAEVPPRPLSPPPINADKLAQLQIPNLINDVKSLALDPYFAIERDAPSIARYIILRFRNLVYTKSLVLPLPDETPSAASDARVPPSNKEPKPKPAKLFKRPEDPTKSGRKRAPSDRQGEKSEKRIKNITKLKTLTTEKRTTGPSVAPPPAPEPEKKKAETVQRQEPQPPLLPLPPTPTYLIMKFPPRSPLPSVANLKARFARFGPLDIDSIRVFWKTHTCKVLYKHKPDAVKAYSFAKSNDLLGQLQVDYSIREVEAAPPAPEPEPPRVEPLSRPAPVPVPVGRLKSILKKPGGGDEAAKDNRVKFMLSGNVNDNNNKADSPPKSPPLPAQPKPNALPTAPQPSVATSARLLDPRQQPNNSVDISHQMLSLLLRCNDIVAGLKKLPGFVPYRPL